jgi:hypothetical protein
MVCGSFASPGNVWERACVVLVIAMLAALFSTLALVIFTYLRLRADLRQHLRRPLLSDEEFLALLPGGAGVDPERVAQVRELAARCFRRLGGELFYPDDRLEEDLHLSDLAPFATRSFLGSLRAALEQQAGGRSPGAGDLPLHTFGDLVLAAASLDEDATRPRTEEIRPR